MKLIHAQLFLLHLLIGANLFAQQKFDDSKSFEFVYDKISAESSDVYVKHFLVKNPTKIRLENFEVGLTKIMDLPENVSLRLTNKFQDQYGFMHQRYDFYYDSIKLEFQTYYIHSKENLVISGNGKYNNKALFPTNKNTLSDNEIYRRVKEIIQPDPSEELNLVKELVVELIYLLTDRGYRLTQKVEVYSRKPFTREFLYLDSETGELLKQLSGIHNEDITILASTRNNGIQPIVVSNENGQFTLKESSRGQGITTYDLNGGTVMDNFNEITMSQSEYVGLNANVYANEIHFGLEKCYDFYKSKFGRNSFDNLGAEIVGLANNK